MIRNAMKTLGSFRSALAVGVGLPFLVAASAYAQEPTPASTEVTTERVIVTGSYIPTAETESALPVTVYTAEVLRKQGANTPVEGIRQLPSFVGNTTTENDSNGGNGTAAVALRGLGPANTLTLINGRRAFLGISISGGTDVNAIPIGALSRTEILKDGASAVYGSDAVAGVVNFIMLNGPGEKPYEGAELFALYGNTTEKDAHVRQVYLRGGVVGLDGKVSIAASGEYYSRANLFSKDRTIATTGDTSNDSTGLGWGGFNNNSPTFAGRISVNRLTLGTTAANPVIGQLVLQNLGNNSPGGLPPGTTRSSNSAGFTVDGYRDFENFTAGTDPSRFNFRAFTPAIPAVEKAEYFVTGRYKIFGDGLQLYGDIMYSHTKQDNALAGAPFAITSTANGLTEARNSPFNPVGIDPNTGLNALASIRYRLQQELGDRKSFFDTDYQRYVAGVNGDFNIKDNGFISRFGYDSGFVYEHATQLKTDSGDATRTLIRQAIAGTLVQDAAGNPIFFDPFIGQGAPPIGVAPTFTNGVQTGTRAYNNVITGQAASYIGHSLFLERDWLGDAKINSHLFPNLWNGGVDFAAGYEHHDLQLHIIPDPVQAAGDQLGFNQAPNTKTLQSVNAVFLELGLPIVTSSMNVPFVRSLDLDIAWRYEKFNDEDSYAKTKASFDNVNQNENFGGTPRVSLRYQPIADLTLRASWGQSFLSPNPFQLFNPVAQNFPNIFDPFKRATFQPPLGVWQGGNPALQPEKTDAYTAGLVWTPKFLPGFTMTMDWYQVYTKDLILSAANFAQLALTLNGQALLAGQAPPFVDPDGCGGGSGAAEAPGGPGIGITRDAQGNVQCIDSLASNSSKRLVQGLDVTAVYEIPTEHWGKFTFSGGLNHFFTWKGEPVVGSGSTNFLGNFSLSIPLAPGSIPWNKGFARGEWEWRHFDFVATGNYTGDFRDDPNFFNTITARTVPSYITLDMQLSYEFVKPPSEAPPTYAKDSKDNKNVPAVTEAAVASIWQRMLWGTKLTVGVNDAFDRTPPSALGAFNDNYDTSLYTIRDRYWYASLSKKF